MRGQGPSSKARRAAITARFTSSASASGTCVTLRQLRDCRRKCFAGRRCNEAAVNEHPVLRCSQSRRYDELRRGSMDRVAMVRTSCAAGRGGFGAGEGRGNERAPRRNSAHRNTSTGACGLTTKPNESSRRNRIFTDRGGESTKAREFNTNVRLFGAFTRPNVRLSGVTCPANVRSSGCDSFRQIPRNISHLKGVCNQRIVPIRAKVDTELPINASRRVSEYVFAPFCARIRAKFAQEQEPRDYWLLAIGCPSQPTSSNPAHRRSSDGERRAQFSGPSEKTRPASDPHLP